MVSEYIEPNEAIKEAAALLATQHGVDVSRAYYRHDGREVLLLSDDGLHVAALFDGSLLIHGDVRWHKSYEGTPTWRKGKSWPTSTSH